MLRVYGRFVRMLRGLARGRRCLWLSGGSVKGAYLLVHDGFSGWGGGFRHP